ncbi:flagellar biosynthetic protein FliO [Parendozoicomonas haliclonae]|uniref:Flagellar protein n=1 Tax=Parendozoicomonas haliclonae TaxID=1960125 RepID=A0A1X7AHQ9_9GAMM|nr:flagellar biosynthetic protein FliO [Parendozoicomonas haliclonae]SMA41948.1 Flagellar protein FliO [Parendozoicomonas haliclonae]
MSKWITPLLKLFLLCGSSLVFAGEPAAEPLTEPETGTGFMDLARVLLSFLAVIALLFACAWWLKRWQPGMAPGRGGMEVKSVLSLGGRDRVVIVQAGERQLLLGVSPGKIVLLGDYDQLIGDPEPSESAAARFSQLLKR